ncbi:MAG: hypothetical protein AB1793_00205 [Candidatus Thermoplasmatota archaeon]
MTEKKREDKSRRRDKPDLGDWDKAGVQVGTTTVQLGASEKDAPDSKEKKRHV